MVLKVVQKNDLVCDILFQTVIVTNGHKGIGYETSKARVPIQYTLFVPHSQIATKIRNHMIIHS